MSPTEAETAPERRPAMAARVAAYLEGAILDRTFEPGSKLPTEEMLSRSFGVSRAVVREAVARLKADGLAHSRQGSGLYVAEPFERRSFKLAEDLGSDRSRMSDFFELRRPIEVATARFAAARRTPDDITRMEAALDEMAAAGDWAAEGVNADLRFHHAIAVATHNSFYVDFLAFLGNVIGDSMRLSRADGGRDDFVEVTMHEHRNILGAIRTRDPEAAGLSMFSHLCAARERMMGSGGSKPSKKD